MQAPELEYSAFALLYYNIDGVTPDYSNWSLNELKHEQACMDFYGGCCLPCVFLTSRCRRSFPGVCDCDCCRPSEWIYCCKHSDMFLCLFSPFLLFSEVLWCVFCMPLYFMCARYPTLVDAKRKYAKEMNEFVGKPIEV